MSETAMVKPNFSAYAKACILSHGPSLTFAGSSIDETINIVTGNPGRISRG